MQIGENKVVNIHYALRLDDGKLVDSSENKEPLTYMQGKMNIIPGLEKALLGKEVGEKLEVKVSPEEGYGARKDDLIQNLPKSTFDKMEGMEDLKPGMQFQTQGPQGPQVVTIMEVKDEEVVVDGNHPLAGQNLNFDVEVVDVRDATEEELQHGHVHGAGGHHH